MFQLYAIATGSAPLLVGLSIAIVALLLISLLLQIFPRMADRSGRHPADDTALPLPVSVHPAAAGGTDFQLVAVITAALSAYLAAQEAQGTPSATPAAGFRVRSIRRIG